MSARLGSRLASKRSAGTHQAPHAKASHEGIGAGRLRHVRRASLDQVDRPRARSGASPGEGCRGFGQRRGLAHHARRTQDRPAHGPQHFRPFRAAAGIRGRDFAGTNHAVGPGVTGWQVGDTVLGEDDATLAEYAAVDQARLAHKPDALSFEQAAAMPLAAVTADLCLGRQGAGGEPGADHRSIPEVWARSPSSSPPHAPPPPRQSAAPATSTWSPRRQQVVDYTRDDFTDVGRTYDLVLDLVGNRGLRELRRVVARAADWSCPAVETRARVSTSARSD